MKKIRTCDLHFEYKCQNCKKSGIINGIGVSGASFVLTCPKCRHYIFYCSASD